MAVHIRMAIEEDAEKLLELILKAYAPTIEMGIHFEAATADLGFIKKHIRNNMCYEMIENGKILATCGLRMPWGPNPGPYGLPHVSMLAVDPETGKKGLGSKMLNWVETVIARDTLKSPAISLGTAEEHPWLVGMYVRKGYEKVGTANLGRGHTTIYMKKVLNHELYEMVGNRGKINS